MAKPIINDEVWKQIRKNLRTTGEPRVKIGVFQSSGSEPDGISIVELAAIHEFGSPAANIPERSFLRATFDGKKAELQKVTATLAKKIMTGKITISHALDVLGQWGVSAIKRRITEGAGIPPPNAPATLKAKDSTRTLVDSSHLLNSITYVKVE